MKIQNIVFRKIFVKLIRRPEEPSDFDVFDPNIKEEDEEEARDYISWRNDRKKLTRGKRRLTRWCEEQRYSRNCTR